MRNLALKGAQMKYFITGLFVVLLSACSSIPTTIANAPKADLQLSKVIYGENDYAGQQVRWGGKIVNITQNNNFSLVEIQHYPLTTPGFPVTLGGSQGRFIARSAEYFDPDVYQIGLLITFSGDVNSGITKTINREERYLPIIDVAETRLWPYRTVDGKSSTYTGAESRYSGYGIYGTGSF